MSEVNIISCYVVGDKNVMGERDKVNHWGDTLKTSRNALFKKIIIPWEILRGPEVWESKQFPPMRSFFRNQDICSSHRNSPNTKLASSLKLHS